MNSLIIGIARVGSAFNYVLNQDTKYISMCGSKPEVSFSIDCGQDQFIKVINGLRYEDADPNSSDESITFFQNLTTQIFKDLKYLQIDETDCSPLHIRLVTTPFELAQIPFEFAFAPTNIEGNPQIPLLANSKRKITLTREVRQESVIKYIWPNKPRILFAWAEPVPEMTVPHQDHLAVLQSIVTPFAKPYKEVSSVKPDVSEFLTELQNASVESIKKKIQEGINENMPYTHIHILAHGGDKLTYGVTEFQLILCKDGMTDTLQKIDGKKLADAIVPVDKNNIPTVVSLSVCDSGHLGNTILPSGSLVYQLHNNGIPCVFASQFPLTQQGSIKLTKQLYYELINACDPRIALYKTRMALKEEQTHDWASLVAYARFPEDINQQIQDAQLKLAFRLMKTTNVWVDYFFKNQEKIIIEHNEGAFNDLQLRLEKSIEQLSEFLNAGNNESTLLTRELRAEHLGLLGSAYKRKAEYLFRLIDFNPEKKNELINQSNEALKSAVDFYKFGFDANADSHWNAMQYLSLKAVTSGSLQGDGDLWTVIKYMAKRDEQNATNDGDKIWAWGTLAELYLLKPLVNYPSNEEVLSASNLAKEYITKIATSSSKYDDAKESTARQLERYINWWPQMVKSETMTALKLNAGNLRKLLPEI